MATTHRDLRRSLNQAWPHLPTLALLSGLIGGLIAQTAAAQALVLEPTLDITSSAVKQTNVAGTPSMGGTTHELVTVLSPGFRVAGRGAHTEVEGTLHLDHYHYARGTQSSQDIPNGHLKATMLARDLGLGADANWTSRQVPAQFTGPASSSSNLVNEYTTTELSVAPFIDKPLGADKQLRARLEKTWIHSTQVSQTLAKRPDNTVLTANLGFLHHPTPLGVDLSLTSQTTEVSGQADPVLVQSVGRARLIYALQPELELGLIVGRESDKVLAQSYQDTVRGLTLGWRPQERSQLDAQVEERFFGKAWKVQTSHRTPWLALNAKFDRQATTYAASAGSVASGGSLRDLFDAMLTTQLPDAAERAQAVNDLLAKNSLSAQTSSARDVYNITAQLRQESSGRMAFMGRRDTLTVAAGRVDATPLTQAQSLLTTASRTREYFFSMDWQHRLAPTWRLTGGLRWTRSHLTPFGQPDVFGQNFGRDFNARLALSTDLSPRAVATAGLRRQIAHSTNLGDSSESAAFAGLTYRF